MLGRATWFESELDVDPILPHLAEKNFIIIQHGN